MRGHMIWFNASKGFGFIRTEDDERLYIAADGFAPDHLPEGRCAGLELTFEREPAADVEGGYRAVAATIIEDSPQRRARARRRGMG
jgi:cold shock CspA family protein